MNSVFGSSKIGLGAATNERTTHLYRLCVRDTLSDVFILFKGNQQLVDEIWGNYDAVVKDDIVFTGAKIVARLWQSDTADSRIRAAAVFKVVAEREPMIGREIMGDADRIL